jgi:hypothetical protein
MVILEHEFGLYGGNFGEYIVNFMKLVKKLELWQDSEKIQFFITEHM